MVRDEGGLKPAQALDQHGIVTLTDPHTRTRARAHTHTHTHTRTHARTNARPHKHTHARTYARTQALRRFPLYKPVYTLFAAPADMTGLLPTSFCLPDSFNFIFKLHTNSNPPCAYGRIRMITLQINPVVHVRVGWITETRKLTSMHFIIN